MRETGSTGVPQAVAGRLHSDRHGIFGAKVAIFFHKAKLWPAFMLSFSYIFILSDGRTKFLWLSLWLFVIYICLIAMAGKDSRGRCDMSGNNGPSGGNHYQFTGSHCYAMCCGKRRERLSGVWSNCSSRQSTNDKNAQRHSACAVHHPLSLCLLPYVNHWGMQDEIAPAPEKGHHLLRQTVIFRPFHRDFLKSRVYS